MFNLSDERFVAKKIAVNDLRDDSRAFAVATDLVIIHPEDNTRFRKLEELLTGRERLALRGI